MSHPHEEVGHESSPYAARIRAIEALLLEKGVLTEPEVQDRISYMEARSPANGAKLVARAWVSPEFKELLLSDTKAAAQELGMDARPGRVRRRREHARGAQPDRLHLVFLLPAGHPRPAARLVQELQLPFKGRQGAPRRHARARVRAPEGVEVAVHDSTADIRYMVLPMRPAGTEDLSEQELAELVTRDDLIGVSVPHYAGGFQHAPADASACQHFSFSGAEPS